MPVTTTCTFGIVVTVWCCLVCDSERGAGFGDDKVRARDAQRRHSEAFAQLFSASRVIAGMSVSGGLLCAFEKQLRQLAS